MKVNRSLSRRAMCVSAMAMAFAVPVQVLADAVVLRKGTDVHLIFDSRLDSKTAQPGDWIKMHVELPVEVDGRVVIPSGSTVRGKIEKVNHRGRYGYNGNVQIHLMPVVVYRDQKIWLEPKNKGSLFSRGTGNAAAATAAGAVVLGPIGLIGGYFIVGKNIHVRPGDKTTVEVAKETAVEVK